MADMKEQFEARIATSKLNIDDDLRFLEVST